MITISYYRESVCAGDDCCNVHQQLTFPDDAVLEDLFYRINILGDERVPFYSGIPIKSEDSVWTLQSNVGDLARLTYDKHFTMFVEYLMFDARTELRNTGIKAVYGTRHPHPTANNCFLQ